MVIQKNKNYEGKLNQSPTYFEAHKLKVSDWLAFDSKNNSIMNYTALNMTEKQLEISQFINSTLVWGLRPYFQRETAELIIFLSNGVSLCAVNIFGVFGNTLSAYVLSRKQMKSPLNALLLKLAFCDFIIGILHFLCNAIPHLLWRYKIGEWYIKLVCFLYRYGILVWQIGKLIGMRIGNNI